MIKTIIFDYDGVIVDSFRNVYSVYKIICRKLHKRISGDIEGFRKMYGKNSQEFHKNLKFTPKQKLIAEEIFRREIVKKRSEIFSGINAVLSELSVRYDLVLISTNVIRDIERRRKQNKILHFFSTVVSSTSKKRIARKKDSLKKYLHMKHLLPKEVIFVGDRTVDYEDTRDVGIKNTIIVEYGWGYDKKIVPKQKFLVKEPVDLLKAIKNIEKKHH